MGKLTVLCGSPRKNGNTDLLVKAFVEGAELHHDVKVFAVSDMKVNPCIGCNSCFKREDGSCFQQDDMLKVYERLMETEILVIASPVYFYGISSQLKAVVDRFHTPMRNSFPVRKMALILAGAAELPGLFDPILLQYKMTLDFFGVEDGGHVLVRGVKEKGDVRNTDKLDEARELGAII